MGAPVQPGNDRSRRKRTAENEQPARGEQGPGCLEEKGTRQDCDQEQVKPHGCPRLDQAHQFSGRYPEQGQEQGEKQDQEPPVQFLPPDEPRGTGDTGRANRRAAGLLRIQKEP